MGYTGSASLFLRASPDAETRQKDQEDMRFRIKTGAFVSILALHAVTSVQATPNPTRRRVRRTRRT